MSAEEKLPEVTEEEVQALFERLNAEAEKGGYHLNPNRAFTLGLIRGLLVNEKRYGYRLCPCRLSEGSKTEDLDAICPCDYRDPDLAEHGCCYCSLYVSGEVAEGKARAKRIPERRPERAQRLQHRTREGAGRAESLPYPVWRCRVCGYLCARDGPPETCPVCRAGKDRFERFM